VAACRHAPASDARADCAVLPRRPTRPDRRRARGAQTGRLRPDLFAGEGDTIDAWLAAQPEQTIPALLPDRLPSDPVLLPDGPRPASAPCDECRLADTLSGPRAFDHRGSPTVRSIICAACGASDTVIRGERGPLTAYCAVCRAQRKRDQARHRVAALRARRRGGA